MYYITSVVPSWTLCREIEKYGKKMVRVDRIEVISGFKRSENGRRRQNARPLRRWMILYSKKLFNFWPSLQMESTSWWWKNGSIQRKNDIDQEMALYATRAEITSCSVLRLLRSPVESDASDLQRPIMDATNQTCIRNNIRLQNGRHRLFFRWHSFQTHGTIFYIINSLYYSAFPQFLHSTSSVFKPLYSDSNDLWFEIYPAFIFSSSSLIFTHHSSIFLSFYCSPCFCS